MPNFSRHYEDILAPRREDNNFMWASRQLFPQVAYKQPTQPSPQSHKDSVLNSPKIQELLNILSQQQNVAKEILHEQVKHILDEIGYNKKLKIIRWLGLVLVKICNKICPGIYVNERNVLQLKSYMGNCPLVFVPSHRSYADFILMSLMCFTKDIAVPAIAAGMDFHGMWGMGTMLRDTGALFMRRTYNNDNLYWTTFKQYIYQLVTKGELPLEFFIEGTRSRSNKSLMPKYGLILMVLKAFFLSQVPDILFVPVNISYDRILEEKLFAFELLGIPKPKETTSGFFKSLRIIKENYGSIYFDFAKPISAKEFFATTVDRSVHSLQPINQLEITENEKRQIPALAHELVYQQQKHCVITIFNLIATVLYTNLSTKADLYTVEDMTREVAWLKEIMEHLGAFVHTHSTQENILKALAVHKNIVRLNDAQQITLIWDNIVLNQSNIHQLKAHDLSEQTITFAVPFIMLQLYINPILHYFVDIAVLVVTCKHSQPLTEDNLFGHYHFLRTLFCQEFITFPTREAVEFNTALKHAIDLKAIIVNEGLYKMGTNKKLEEVLYNSIDSFIFTYFVVCLILLQVSSTIIDEKTVLTKVQAEVENTINNKELFIHPYSLSLDTISNCLNTLSSQKVLYKTRNASSIFYEINHDQVSSIKNRLAKYMTPVRIPQVETVQLHLQTKL